MNMTRRSVLEMAIAAGATAVAGTRQTARAQTVRRRFSATSTQGKAMLAQYAKAVGLMKDKAKFPPSSPRSWEFQWYTHWIPGPPRIVWDEAVEAKKKKLDDVFAGKPANDPDRLLAEAMWDNCQSHAANPNDPNFFQRFYFCVWHRHYVYYFEEIIRAVLNDTTFTLPYWDYLSGNVSDLSLPPEFLDTSSPLFQANRNSWVNKGDRIDRPNPGSLNLRCMNEPQYIDTPHGSIGFCPMLDQNPHGQVHGLVGQLMNMGSVPNAANDPIFWLHHCNIDRIWESWNRVPGRPNPAWPNRKFPFADGAGKRVDALPANANRVSLLKYDYDTYAKPPGPASPGPTTAALTTAAPTVTRAFAPQPVSLGGSRLQVTLQPPSGPAAQPLANQPMEVPPPTRRMYLTLRGISAPTGSASTYNVYLDLPDSVTGPTPQDPFYAGTLHFFGAGHEHEDSGHSTSFNVTELVRSLTVKKAMTATPRVTLIRHGEPESEAPTIRQILLTEV